MEVKIEQSWKEALAGEFEKPYFASLVSFLRNEKAAGKVIYPPGSQIFRAFDLTPVQNVKVVILGQDPYHGPGQAHGLSVLFKRLDVNKDVLDIVLAKENKKEEPKKVVKPAKPAKEEISIDDFDKVELVVGKILEAKKHPKADKLLVFKVDIGTEVRQIVSGIAKFYKPEELIGKKVVVVKNLKPIKLRGEDSCGMLLCAANDEDSALELLNVDKMNPGDSVQ